MFSQHLAVLCTSWQSLIASWRSTMTEVDLSGSISNAALRTVARSCPALRVLLLSQRSSLSDPYVASGSRWHKLKYDLACLEKIDHDTIWLVAKSCTELRRVDVSSCKAQTAFIVNCPHLEDLDCSYNEEGYFTIFSALEDFPCASTLTALDVSRSIGMFRKEGLGFAALVVLGQFCPRLASLRLARCDLNPFSPDDNNPPGLRNLLPSQCARGTDGRADAGCPLLHTLDLFGCRQVSDADIEALCSELTEIRHLHLSECLDLSNRALGSIAEHCHGLRSLHLMGLHSNFSGDALIRVAESCASLEALDLSSTRSCFGHETLARVVRATGANLISLHLFECLAVTSATLHEIGKHCGGLRCLDVSMDALVSDSGILSVAKGCPHLHTLCLSGCDQVSLPALCEALKGLTELRRLDVRYTFHETNSAALSPLIHRLVQSCPQLTRLALDGSVPPMQFLQQLEAASEGAFELRDNATETNDADNDNFDLWVVWQRPRLANPNAPAAPAGDDTATEPDNAHESLATLELF